MLSKSELERCVLATENQLEQSKVKYRSKIYKLDVGFRSGLHSNVLKRRCCICGLSFKIKKNNRGACYDWGVIGDVKHNHTKYLFFCGNHFIELRAKLRQMTKREGLNAK